MPPAFNLSQDQTLQLNLIPANPGISAGANYILQCFTQSKRGLLLCEHLMLGDSRAEPANRTRSGALQSSAHTYRLRIFKERLRQCCGLPLRKQMGSGVLDAAEASKTAIMTDSYRPRKACRRLFHRFRYTKTRARAGLGSSALLVLVAGIGFEPM